MIVDGEIDERTHHPDIVPGVAGDSRKIRLRHRSRRFHWAHS